MQQDDPIRPESQDNFEPAPVPMPSGEVVEAAVPAAPRRPAGKFYTIDSTCVSITEYMRGGPILFAPVFALVGIVSKLMRAQLTSSTDDLPIESLLPFEIPEARVSPESMARIKPFVTDLQAAGFLLPIYFCVEDVKHATVTNLAVFTHNSGRAIACVHDRAWHISAPPKQYLFVEFITRLSGGGAVVTTGAKPDTLWPESVTIKRKIGAGAGELWAMHQQELAQGSRTGSILQATTPAAARDTIESYHKTLRDFHVERGLFKPLDDDGREALARAESCHDALHDLSFFSRVVYAEVNQTAAKKKAGWTGAAILLVVTLGLFIGMGKATGGSGPGAATWQFLAIIVGVLFVHELGHYVMMKIFGYRDLKMFFIPMLGAAVTGKATKVAGWKRVMVALAGPLPGITAGIVLGILGLVTHKQILVDIAAMSLLLNGFNLLPFLPLDGGHVVHQVLFCRHSLLDVVFRAVAGLGLVGLSMVFNDGFLRAIGIFMLITIPTAMSVNKITTAVRECKLPEEEQSTLTVPPSIAREIIPRVVAAYPKRAQRKSLAVIANGVYETLHTKPPGVAASVGLLALHGAALTAAIIFGSVFFVARQGNLGGLFNAAMQTANHVDLDPKTVQSHPAGAPVDTTPRLTIIATCEDAASAKTLFDSLGARVPSQADMLLLQNHVLLAMPEGDDAARKQWIGELEKSSKHVKVATAEAGCTISLTCLSPTEAVAKNLDDSLKHQFAAAGSTMVIPAWASPDPRTEAARQQHARARATLYKLQFGRYEQPDAESPERKEQLAVYKKIAEANRLGDKKQVKELQEEMVKQAKAAEEKRTEGFKNDPSLDQDVVREYLALQKSRDAALAPSTAPSDTITTIRPGDAYKIYNENYIKNLGPLMGQYESVDGKLRPADAAITAHNGSVRHEGQFMFFDITLNQPTTGIPALLHWLSDQKCTNFKYLIQEYGISDEGELD